MSEVKVSGYAFKGFIFLPSEKGVYSKRKECAYQRNTFLPFRVDPFLERFCCEQAVTNVM